jgi:hypothetical protein
MSYICKKLQTKLQIMIAKPNLSATLRAMKAGAQEHIPFDMFKHASVRNCACNLGAELRRVYHVNVDRVGKVYIVTREQ